MARLPDPSALSGLRCVWLANVRLRPHAQCNEDEFLIAGITIAFDDSGSLWALYANSTGARNTLPHHAHHTCVYCYAFTSWESDVIVQRCGSRVECT